MAAAMHQQEIEAVLKKADMDLRELARHMQKAKEGAGLEQSEASLLRSKAVQARLQSHRAAIRKWSVQKGVAATAQKRLAVMRSRIEAETKKMHAVEIEVGLNKIAADQKHAKDRAVAEDTIASPSKSSCPSEPAENDAEAGGEVKVLADQLRRTPQEGDLEGELICKICLVHLVGCEPKMTSCSHLFCGDCIAKWFAVQPSNQTWAGRAQSAGTVPCPVCKEKLSENDLHTVCPEGSEGSAMLYQMLASTQIVCGNGPKCRTDGKCNWTGDYLSYQDHIKSCTNEAIFEETVDEEIESPVEVEAEEEAVQVGETNEEPVELCASIEATEVVEHWEDAIDEVQSSAAQEELAISDTVAEEPSLGSLIEQLLELRMNEQASNSPITSESSSPEDVSPITSESSSPQDCDYDLYTIPESVEESPKARTKVPAAKEPKNKRSKAKDAKDPKPVTQPMASAATAAWAQRMNLQEVKQQQAQQQQQATAAWAQRMNLQEVKQQQAQQQQQAAQAAWAAQAAQWQALQWQTAQALRFQQARAAQVAYAGQVAQWQMARTAQIQAAQAAWSAQAARAER